MAVKVRQRRGKWWVFIDHNGKRKAKCIGESKRAAQRVAEKIQAKLTLGQFEIGEEKERRPFDAYFRGWLDTYVRPHCKERTWEVYESAFRVSLLPFFGQKDLAEITREDVKRFVAELAAKRFTRSTIKAYIAPLRECLNHACEDGHLDRNPCQGIMRATRMEKGEQQEKIDFLTREEVALLLETCQEHYPFVLCLVRTGMRLGEVAALKWEDVDFNGRFIEVRRSYSHGRITIPKSGRGRRVDMSLRLTETLKTLLLERKKETLRKGWKEVPPWVFANEAGSLMDTDNLRKRVWPKLLARAGLRQIRIHDLRHTYASLLIQNGESLAYVKEQMGHHSIQVTVDIYGHLVPGGNKAAVDRLDDLESTTIRNLYATKEETGTDGRIAGEKKPLKNQRLI